jgi:DNA polymerase-3 subunit epsilon
MMIRHALILDTETTALDPSAGKVIEVGVILYSVEHASTIACASVVLPADANPCEAINGIPPAILADAESLAEFRASFALLLRRSDVIVAHNAEFDRQWFTPSVAPLRPAESWLSLPWLCTMNDFAWPRGKAGDGLVSLALAHGVGVSSAHRALTDCLLIAALFDRMPLFGRDLQAMFAHAMRPTAIFRALVSFEQKDLAKNAGFKWDANAKIWTRRMAVDDAADLPFKTSMVSA